MCVIIDKNTFGPVFSKESEYHDDFEPIYRWISEGCGKIVYGGTKYKDELRQSRSYLKLFRRFDEARRVVKLSDEEVDIVTKEISAKLDENVRPTISKSEFKTKFNDPHIMSIVIVSKCKIVCTNDKGLSDFLKDTQFYPEGFNIPKIYRKRSNKGLLINKNIADICKPCTKLKKIRDE